MVHTVWALQIDTFSDQGYIIIGYIARVVGEKLMTQRHNTIIFYILASTIKLYSLGHKRLLMLYTRVLGQCVISVQYFSVWFPNFDSKASSFNGTY